MKKLKAIRERIGLTQKALGEAIGIGPSQLASLEAGTRRPSVEVALRLTDQLQLEPADALDLLHELAGLPSRVPFTGLSALPIQLDGQAVELLELVPGTEGWTALVRPTPSMHQPEPTARRVPIAGLALVAAVTARAA